jgi:hypothetical protein
MAQDPSFLMYYKDILVSCADWDADVLGWYLRLLCHQADKPDGLDDNMESLANLAGVKFSQFDRFKLCWKRTLEAKWRKTAQGNLINLKLAEVIDNRKRFSEKQQLRGLIGFFVKKFRAENSVTEKQGQRFAKMISLCLKLNMTNDEKDNAYKRTLIAFYANAIGNGNNIKEEEGTGEEEKINPVSSEFVFEPELLTQKVLVDKEFKRQFFQHGIPENKLEEWLQNFNKHLKHSFGEAVEKSEKDYRWHFGNWIVSQSDFEHPENFKILKSSNGNNTATTVGNSKTGTSTERSEALQQWGL